jgi:lipoyl(octanoyl) transferase
MTRVAATRDFEWRTEASPWGYNEAVLAMEERVAAIAAGTAPELVWLLQHPPLYTAGTSAKPEDLVAPARFPVYTTGRGGQYTYHGPGQRVAYVLMDLSRVKLDLHAYITGLERWLIGVLSEFGVRGEVRQGRVGVWVTRPGGREDKIAAIGIRVRRGISYHGISLNIAPDLDHFSGIVPCGIREHGVTSLKDLGVAADMVSVDAALRKHFEPAVLGSVGSPAIR